MIRLILLPGSPSQPSFSLFTDLFERRHLEEISTRFAQSDGQFQN